MLRVPSWLSQVQEGASRYVLAAAVIGATAWAMDAFGTGLDLLSVGLIFLLGVFSLALWLGSGPAVLAAVLSFLAFNFFFIPPYNTFAIAKSRNLFALIVYLAIAIVTGQLVARVRVRTEAAMRNQRRAAVLAESDALKSVLLATVSHELRTPLAAIKASATSLLDESVAWRPEDRTEFLEAINEETDRLTLMVGNMLDLSRIEGGALVPDKGWYDVAELVADVQHRLESRSDGHPLRTDVEPDLPLACFDYIQIAQVLTNLVENAVKYTPAGTPILIAGRQVPGAIELSVRDRGPGIPPERLERVFETFYRYDPAGRATGVGIGLSISRGLVEAHGSRLMVESHEGEGTTFRFRLPLGPETGAPG